eukprot:CAMPEP_0119194458 /NCGR_PEP_ID=MMETSP1316-20130426/4231_1 /TAXON_ID=41880 /ORGANISM="Pycnococcus provasolii, Strain RCC2336" /LENGTH=333 /DNA_ID=CAMNT_0007189795 /DNA_START=81 /DNA_END=1082 /DNA_ORIENTATION=-
MSSSKKYTRGLGLASITLGAMLLGGGASAQAHEHTSGRIHNREMVPTINTDHHYEHSSLGGGNNNDMMYGAAPDMRMPYGGGGLRHAVTNRTDRAGPLAQLLFASAGGAGGIAAESNQQPPAMQMLKLMAAANNQANDATPKMLQLVMQIGNGDGAAIDILKTVLETHVLKTMSAEQLSSLKNKETAHISKVIELGQDLTQKSLQFEEALTKDATQLSDELEAAANELSTLDTPEMLAVIAGVLEKMVKTAPNDSTTANVSNDNDEVNEMMEKNEEMHKEEEQEIADVADDAALDITDNMDDEEMDAYMQKEMKDDVKEDEQEFADEWDDEHN